ncbi:Cullin-domain-containing protein [Auricularia subglabra TFB-10046 SS5]|nr:Cullin-domain-containing protein [Auricularia subglabra TFB-10046 SS5]
MLHNKGKDVADKVKMALERRCGELYKDYKPEDHDPVNWTAIFIGKWNVFFSEKVPILCSMLAYLDRGYLLPQNLPSIRQQAVDMGRKYIFERDPFPLRIRQGITTWAQSERLSSKPDDQRLAFKSLVVALDALGLYNELFEKIYVAHADKFYRERSDVLCEQYMLSARAFLDKWKVFAASEDDRAKAVLLPTSWHDAERTAEEAFMEKRMEWVCEAALKEYMELPPDLAPTVLSGLRDLHSTAARVGKVEVLRDAWLRFLKARVEHIVSADFDAMVDNLLHLRAFALRIVSESFGEPIEAGDRGQFAHALDDAFTRGFVKGKTKPAEMIAKFLDAKMQQGQREMGDGEWDTLLDRVLALFRYTADKDVFRTFYTRALARRLLKARSASDDAEKKVIQKLREEHDPEFGKGDEMFKDLALSRDLLAEFQTKASAPPGMSVMVLQQSAWPIAPRGARVVDLPPEMLKGLVSYAAYYNSKHSGRKLEWHHALGTATITARFPGGKKELSVSLFQAVVLLLFNDAPRLSMLDIHARTHLEPEELTRTLQSLSLGRHRILKKLSPGKDVQDADEFEFNEAFTDARTKLRLPTIQAPAEVVDEDKRARSQIDGERQYAIDAAVVRLMKSNKTMMHKDLVQQVVEAVAKHFQPSVDLLKKRIEKLIEEGYMERAPDSKQKYVYCA